MKKCCKLKSEKNNLGRSLICDLRRVAGHNFLRKSSWRRKSKVSVVRSLFLGKKATQSPHSYFLHFMKPSQPQFPFVHHRARESTLLENETAAMAQRLQVLKEQMLQEKEAREAASTTTVIQRYFLFYRGKVILWHYHLKII